MSALADYNPIKSLELPGGTVLDKPKGLIVVVGPNSSGKTLLLKDIEAYFRSGLPAFKVLRAITPATPLNLDQFLSDLVDIGALRPLPGDVFGINVPNATLEPQFQRHQLPRNNLVAAHNEFQAVKNGTNERFFSWLGPTIVSLLSLANRLELCKPAPRFDHNTHSAETPIQRLVNSRSAIKAIMDETSQVFGNLALPDAIQQGNYELRVTGTPDRPPQEDTLVPKEFQKYRSIVFEGDGYKSYVGLCIALLIGRRPLCLIDEPELCLHPPQAYRIGCFLGKHGQSKAHATFVATHSSQVLRGILDTADCVTIGRLSRKGDAFLSHLIPESELKGAVHNPRTRADAILDGLFSRGAILVESDGDREVYQAACEGIASFPSQEVHFVPMWGTGGFAETSRFYRRLNIPVAIISDLDQITETGLMKRILDALDDNPDSVKSSMETLISLAAEIKRIPPSVSPQDIVQALQRICGMSMEWDNDDDKRLREEIHELDESLRRLKRLKEGGVEAYSIDYPKIKDSLLSVITLCSSIGLFFVSIGSLEDWVQSLMLPEYPRKKKINKMIRAAIMAAKIREAPTKKGDVWQFMETVLAFLKAREN